MNGQIPLERQLDLHSDEFGLEAPGDKDLKVGSWTALGSFIKEAVRGQLCFLALEIKRGS